MRRFLIWLSGARPEILRRSPGDRGMYEGIGGAVLTTAVLAGVSFAFALTMALHAPLPASIGLGLLWALAIMNLDRWLVASIHRSRAWWRNLLFAILPRLALAALFGVVISTPLVLQIFDKEIQIGLTTMQRERDQAFRTAQDRSELAVQIRELTGQETALEKVLASGGASGDPGADPEVVRLRALVDARQRQVDEIRDEKICEMDGTCGSKERGEGPIAREHDRKLREAERRLAMAQDELTARQREVGKLDRQSRGSTLSATKTKLSAVRANLKELRAQRDGELAAFTERNGEAGLLARIEALGRVSAGNGGLAATRLLLFLLITALECMPVLVKVMQTLGEPNNYEKILRMEEDKVLRVQRERIRNEQVAALIENDRITSTADQLRSERDRAMPSVVQAQVRDEVEVRTRIQEMRRRSTLDDLRANPGRYADADGWPYPHTPRGHYDDPRDGATRDGDPRDGDGGDDGSGPRR
ncbi:DUF4407 domain-containing protein [Streptosporangium sp. NPDC051022]|uniref:DUF4407 domain-containing protein n=1 Tax=Streptosporangium sp. NPDC051022 TaxID=3155752 RepID=UPI00342D876E